MNNTIRTGLLMALLSASTISTRADSGAEDRSNAFGYQFTDTQLNDSFPQLTNLPTVYLQIYKTEVNADGTSRLRQPTDPGDYSADCPALEALNYIFHDNEKHDWYYRSKIIIRDDWGTIKERNEWLGVRGRGNSSWYLGCDWGWYKKKPFRLKFDKKTDLLTRKENGVEVNDYATDKNWTLLANYYDVTHIRNAMACEVQKRMGMTFCPAYKFVDVVVNGEYMGTYQISDHVNIADRRVPINEDTGYLLEGNRYDSNGRFQEDPYIKVTFGKNDWENNAYESWDFLVNVKNPDPDIATESGPTKDPKYNVLTEKLTKVANLLCWPQEGDNWRKYVDMKSAVDAFVAMEITGNYDGAVGNNYAYMDNIDSKIVFGPLWDFDLAWNYKVNSEDTQGKHFWEYQFKTPFGRLCELAYNDPYFMKAVYERWKKLYDNGLETFLKAKAAELAATVRQSVELNFKGKGEGGAGNDYGYKWADNNNYTSIDNIYEVMTSFIKSHIADLNTAYEKQYADLHCADLQECTDHDYQNCMFAKQADGTYRRVCNNCGEVEAEGAVYYYFTVYPESSTTERFYAQSWQPGETTPNAIATIDADVSPEGYNIVNVRKDAAGNKTCADLRLVDGHPFYSDDKFVAAQASYQRTVSNTWGTMILPFDLQQAENETASFFHLGEVATDEQGIQTLVMNAIDPADAAAAAAGYTPVFFMAKNQAKTVTATAKDVTVAKVGKKTIWEKSTVEGWTLTGVMQRTQFNVTDEAYTANDYYYIKTNEFWHATKDLVTNPFRAYLWTPKTQGGATARSLRIALGDEANSVKSLSAESSLAIFASQGELSVVAPRAMDVSISTLGGVVLRKARLQAGERMNVQTAKGVYIVNGVKVIVK